MQTRHYGVWPKGMPYSLPPAAQSVYHNLQSSAERFPNRSAINYYGRSVSYAGLLQEVQRVAVYLHDHANIQPNDRVAIFMQNAPQFVIAYYAILAANAVIVPVNPMCRQAELRHVLLDCDAKALVFGCELGAIVDEVWEDCHRPKLICARYLDYIDPETDLELPVMTAEPAKVQHAVDWADVLSSKGSAPEHTRLPEDWCIIPYSSGTTGHPKGCLHTHSSVNATIRAYTDWMNMECGSKVLASLPFCHVTGMQNSMNLPIYTGSTIYLTTRWNARVAATLIEVEKIEHWRSITTMMIDFLSLPDIGNIDLTSLKSVGGGGAQMPKSVAQKMRQLIGLDYIEAYGLTETMAPTHINPVCAPKEQCLGIPIFDVDCRIIDLQTMTELGPNQQGEIVINAPQVFTGYWKRPEETKAAFARIDAKRFLRTGDIGYVDDEGYFFLVDRLKRMINVSGFKVWPAEVEAILYKRADISQACIVGDPDPRTGEAVRAVIVLKQGCATPSQVELNQWCQANMAAYKVPQRFEFRLALPRSGMGKISWKEL